MSAGESHRRLRVVELAGANGSLNARQAPTGYQETDLSAEMPIPGTRLPFRTRGRPALVIFHAHSTQIFDSPPENGTLTLRVDGKRVAHASQEWHTADLDIRDVTLMAYVFLNAGEHEVEASFSTKDGLLVLGGFGNDATMQVIELGE